MDYLLPDKKKKVYSANARYLNFCENLLEEIKNVIKTESGIL